jgi:hypothetical protein
MGIWAKWALAMSGGVPHRFSILIKLPGLAGDVLAAALVWRIYAREYRVKAAGAFAAYCLSLPMILVGSYHGNTDCAYASLTLLAAFLLETARSPFAAGVALAAALNVKLLPLVLLPIFFLYRMSLREWARFAGGLALGIVPYALLGPASWGAINKNILHYKSQQNEWGLIALFRYAAQHGPLETLAKSVEAFYVTEGRYIVVLTIIVVAIAGRALSKWSLYELGAVAWALFLVLTPGFGVQYSVCVVPLLFAASLDRAIVYSLLAGTFLFLIYSAHVYPSYPYYSDVAPFTQIAVVFGLLAWASLVVFVGRTLRRANS